MLHEEREEVKKTLEKFLDVLQRIKDTVETSQRSPDLEGLTDIMELCLNSEEEAQALMKKIHGQIKEYYRDNMSHPGDPHNPQYPKKNNPNTPNMLQDDYSQDTYYQNTYLRLERIAKEREGNIRRMEKFLKELGPIKTKIIQKYPDVTNEKRITLLEQITSLE